jgi:hypothetical protein
MNAQNKMSLIIRPKYELKQWNIVNKNLEDFIWDVSIKNCGCIFCTWKPPPSYINENGETVMVIKIEKLELYNVLRYE